MKATNNLRIKLVFYRTLYSQSAASLTMGSIAACLRKKNYLVDLCLLEKNSLDNYRRILEITAKYNIILAKPNFQDFQEMFPVLKALKDQKVIKRVFLCGPLASLNAEDIIFNHKWIDGIILNNAEETFCDLIESLSSHCNSWDLNCLCGIWRSPTDGKIKKNKPRPINYLLLDQIPFPARDIEKKENVNYVNIESSRGCTFKCGYCHVPLYYGGARILRNPKLVVDEIEYLNRELGKTLFIFNDSCFWSSSSDNKRIINFCREIKKRKLHIKIYVYFRLSPFPEEKIIKALAETGLVRVFLGLENISENAQIIYNKKIDPIIYQKIKKILDKYNINIHLGFFVFHPYATLSEIKINLKYLYNIKEIFRLGVISEPLRIIPGSPVYYKLIKDGLLQGKKKFDQITYNYKFQDRKVGLLFKNIRKIFLYNPNNLGYSLEYYCVYGELLKTLITKGNRKLIKCLKRDYVEFYKYRNRAMDQLIKYLYRLIKTVDGNIKYINKTEKQVFIKELKEIIYALATKWGIIIEKVRSYGGEKIIKELPTGQERI